MMRHLTLIIYQNIYHNLPGANEFVYDISYIYILLIFNDKYKLFKVIHYNYIIKNGVEFTKTSELSEPLPLPHTKGTKPAP